MAQGQFEFFQMRCFVAVAEALSFRRAAEQSNPEGAVAGRLRSLMSFHHSWCKVSVHPVRAVFTLAG